MFQRAASTARFRIAIARSKGGQQRGLEVPNFRRCTMGVIATYKTRTVIRNTLNAAIVKVAVHAGFSYKRRRSALLPLIVFHSVRLVSSGSVTETFTSGKCELRSIAYRVRCHLPNEKRGYR